MAIGTYYLIYLNSGKIEQGTKKAFTSRIPIKSQGVNVFIQNTKPESPFPYWKVEEGVVVDMDADEAEYKGAQNEYERIARDVFLGYAYVLSTTLDYAVSTPAIQPREITRIQSDPNIHTDTKLVEGVDMLYLYFNTPRSQDEELLGDPNIDFDILFLYDPDNA